MATTASTRRGAQARQVRIAPQAFTLEEFLRLPEKKPALEFEEGRVTRKVSPKGWHSSLQYAAAEWFNRRGQPQKLARAFPELRATFGSRSYVPDVSVYRWERVPRTPDGKVANDFFVPPDIAIEICSPGQRISTLVRRCRWYVENGVQAALVVDPAEESVVFIRPGQEPIPLRAADEIDLTNILPSFRLAIADLFAALRHEWR